MKCNEGRLRGMYTDTTSKKSTHEIKREIDMIQWERVHDRERYVFG